MADIWLTSDLVPIYDTEEIFGYVDMWNNKRVAAGLPALTYEDFQKMAHLIVEKF